MYPGYIHSEERTSASVIINKNKVDNVKKGKANKQFKTIKNKTNQKTKRCEIYISMELSPFMFNCAIW